MSDAPRIVVISPLAPSVQTNNAGQRYLGELARLLPPSAVFVVPEASSTSTTNELPDDSRVVRIQRPAGLSDPRGLRLKLKTAHDWVEPIRPRDWFWEALRADKRARNVVARADVIDVQWPEFIGLAARLKRANPRARLIATMHDVPSQGARRERQHAPNWRRWWRKTLAVVQAKHLENEVSKVADQLVVFSDKDRGLLPRGGKVTVIHPPATAAWEVERGHTPDNAPRRADDRSILFVGPLTRPENLDALSWFMNEVMPTVRQAVPDARVLHAGTSSIQRSLFANTADIEFLGFIPDLAGLQRDVSVAIAPLRQGAGVKFKVIDSLFEGLPIVSTSVGTEGIGDGNFMPPSFDSPSAFARATIQSLMDPDAAAEHVQQAQRWARDRYGWTQFERSVRAVYGLPGETRAPTPTGSGEPIASVVMPVLNGESGLPDALAALARQPEARSLEIVIADNGSNDRTRAVAETWAGAFHTVRIADASSRRGINHARNIGLLAATTEKVLLCDHDDEARVGWVSRLVEALDRADVAGGLAVSHVLSGESRALESTFEREAVHAGPFGYLPYTAGGSMGVRRSAALAVGGYDESFVRGHDEVDFCWRLQRAGYSLVGVEEAVLDYRQRARALDAGRQRFHSARTQIQLWTRYNEVAPLRPVSFKGSLRSLARSVSRAPRLLHTETRFEAARALGWSLGTVVGHLKYRLFGSPPAPILLTD